MYISSKDLMMIKDYSPSYCLKNFIKAIKNSYDEKHLKRFMSNHKDLMEYFI
jgi:hypothetical protein